MTGAVWFVPGWRIPVALWLIGVGLIELGVNAARYLNGIKTRGSGIILGISALLYGLGVLLGLSFPFLPILFILLGAYVLFKCLYEAWRDRTQSAPSS